MMQNGEGVVLRKSTRNKKKTKRFQDEVTTIPESTQTWWNSEEKKNANSTSSSKSQKKKTTSNSTRGKGKKQSHTTKEAKKMIPKGEYEVLTDSEDEEELKVTTSKVESSKKTSSSKSKKKKRKKRRKKSGDISSLKNPESKASKDLKKKQNDESNQKFAAKLNKLRGCYANDNERAGKKKLMELMTFLEGSTASQLREGREKMRSEKGEVKVEMKSNRGEVEDRFVMICEEFIDGNHPTKILHKSWNERFVKIMGSISDRQLRRQQMVMNLLTSADLTDDQRTKVFAALETNTKKKLPFLEMTEDLLPSCDPMEYDPDSLMKKADLKLRHNGISKSWNLITSSSTPIHQFTKEEIMEYIGGDEDFNFFDLYKGFIEFDNFFSHFDFLSLLDQTVRKKIMI